jgi:hypothetical protein
MPRRPATGLSIGWYTPDAGVPPSASVWILLQCVKGGRRLELRRFLAFGVAAAAFVGGCASDPSSVSEPPIVEVSVDDVGAIDFPLDPYLNVGGPAYDVERGAYQILMERCMAGFGFTVDPRPAVASADLRAGKYGLVDLNEALQHGYNNPLTIDDGADDTVTAEPETEAYYAVAYGEGPFDTYNGLQIPEAGCHGAAERTLDEGAEPVADPMFGQALVNRASNLAEQDSRVVAAFDAWSECMARSGYDYDDPWEANDDPAFDGPEANQHEISVATADVACKEEVDLVDTWAAVEMAYQERLIEENSVALAALLESLEVRRRNAAEVVEREA